MFTCSLQSLFIVTSTSRVDLRLVLLWHSHSEPTVHNTPPHTHTHTTIITMTTWQLYNYCHTIYCAVQATFLKHIKFLCTIISHIYIIIITFASDCDHVLYEVFHDKLIQICWLAIAYS